MSYDRFGKDSAGRRHTPEIEAGNISCKVTIRRDVGTLNARGDHVPDYTGDGSLVCKPWVQILSPHADEPTMQGAIIERAITIMRMRYRPGITPGMRVEYRGRLINIFSVRDATSRRKSLQLECRELVDV